MPGFCEKCHCVGSVPLLPCRRALFCRSGSLGSTTLQTYVGPRSSYSRFPLPVARLTGFQNLIPLVIRPLRLILPSEWLRSVRIVMLKATHLPHVFVIWAFEKISGPHSRTAKVTTFSGGPQSPALARRAPRLAVNSPRLLMASFPSTVGKTQHTNRPQTQTGPPESDAQLKALVAKLSTQVEELTAMVSQLREHREASTLAA